MNPRLLLALLLALAVPLARAADHGVILLYHRVSEAGPDATRVSPARFAAHLDLIAAQGYHVVPLAELLAGVYDGTGLPERAVALTFDDAYRSVGEEAYALLRERGMPFTVFVATDVVDQGGAAFLSWGELQRLAEEGLATFGAHSLSHAHLESLPVAARAREIEGSVARMREQLGSAVLDIFAYPFGEYSRATEALLQERRFFGLAQQSGAVSSATRRTRVPRFPLYTGGDSDERLRTALAARPLPLRGSDEGPIFFAPGETPPGTWRFQPGDGAYRRAALRCYAASGEAVALREDGDALRVTLPPLRPGRNKVNCTAPAADGDGYFWYSRLWLRADAEGRWLRE